MSYRRWEEIEEFVSDEQLEFLEKFGNIYAHDDVIHVGSGEKEFYSYSSSRGMSEINYDQKFVDINSVYRDMTGEVVPPCEDGQLDFGSGVGNGIVNLTVGSRSNKKLVVSYDPMSSSVRTTDIFHTLNEFTSAILDVIMYIVENWHNYMGDFGVDEDRKDIAIIDGDVYRLDKSAEIDRFTMDEARENVKNAVEALRDSMRNILEEKDENPPFYLMNSEAAQLRKNEVFLYSIGGGNVYIYMDIDVTVSMIGGGNKPMPVEMPDEWKHDLKGTVKIRAKASDEGRWPLHIDGIYFDRSHPHRSGGTDGEFCGMCMGNVDIHNPEEVNEVVDVMDRIKKSFKKVNPWSFMGTEGVEWCKTAGTYKSHYRDTYRGDDDE